MYEDYKKKIKTHRRPRWNPHVFWNQKNMNYILVVVHIRCERNKINEWIRDVNEVGVNKTDNFSKFQINA